MRASEQSTGRGFNHQSLARDEVSDLSTHVCILSPLSSGTGHNHSATPRNHNQTSHLYHKYATFGDLSACAPLTSPSAINWKTVFGGKSDKIIFLHIKKANTVNLSQSLLLFLQFPFGPLKAIQGCPYY